MRDLGLGDSTRCLFTGTQHFEVRVGRFNGFRCMYDGMGRLGFVLGGNVRGRRGGEEGFEVLDVGGHVKMRLVHGVPGGRRLAA